MTRHSGISIDDDGVTLVIASEAPGAGADEVAFAPALIVLAGDGHAIAGRRARRLAAAGTGATFEDFTLRVGDPVPVIGSDGSARTAADLVALTITCLLRDQASAQGPDQHLAIAHPSSWGSYQLAELRAALTRAGLDGLPTAFVPRAVAAVHAAGASRAEAVVVADLGQHRTEIATLRGASVDGVRSDDLGAADLDRAVLRHVLGQVAGEPSDRDDLTARCRAARRELNAGPVAVVEVPTTAGIERIRVTRGEFEDAIRESVSVTASNVCRALGDAVEKGATTYDVVIVGDGADVPLLSQTLSAEAGFGPGVMSGAATVAMGAALMAGARAKAARVTRQRTGAPSPRPAATPSPAAARATTAASARATAAAPAGIPAGASSGVSGTASRPGPDSAPSLPTPGPSATRRPSDDPHVRAVSRPRPPERTERPSYQAAAPTPRNDWAASPPQRSGGRVRTAIVAAAAGLAVLVGGAAVTSVGGGHGGGGGWHASR